MRGSIAAAVLATCLACVRPANATLAFYYDPETGNVAFDTSGVPGDSIWLYGLWLNDEIAGFNFNPDAQVRLTLGSIETPTPTYVAEASLSERFGGYLTIGDILPTGLTSEQWSSLNNWYYSVDSLQELATLPGYWIASYRDESDDSQRIEEAEFVYGQPDRPYENRWDLVDPDDLDWATAATLVYDPATGELVIDTARGEGGGHISWFILESEGGFLPENFTPWIDSPFTSATTDLIGFAADAVEPGRYSAGRILAPGLTLDEVESTFTSARFVSRAGFGGGNFSFEEDGLDFAFALAPAVPEPTPLLLAAIAAVGLAQRRS